MLVHAGNGGVDHLDSGIMGSGKRFYDAKRTSTGRQISAESVKNDPSRHGSLLHNNLESTMEVKR
jgi:hypothetical protein